jgi:hypothetical protein
VGVKFPDSGKFKDLNLSIYGDLGVSDFVTFLFSTSYKKLSYKNHSNAGFGDIEVGAKRKILTDPFLISIQVLLKIPPYTESTELSLGNAQVDLESRLLFGQSLKILNKFGYWGFESAYRMREREPSDEIRFLLEAGVLISTKLYARSKLDAIFSTKGTATYIANTPAITTDYDLTRLEMTLGYRIFDSFSAELTWMQALTGRNTSIGEVFSGGLAVSF